MSFTNPTSDPKKILIVGKSGAGKTGALASLVAAGLKVRMMDTDKGAPTLRSLLTQTEYPYGKWCAEHGIDIDANVSCVPIDQEMHLKNYTKKVGNRTSTERILGPKNANAWDRCQSLLENWSYDGQDHGHVETWGEDTVLVLDSFSTMSKMAYYYWQAFNGRLGAPDIGYDYQRDVGQAQSALTRMCEWLHSSSIKCHVIIITHIRWVDDSQGYNRNPDQMARDGERPSPDGYPMAIGQALSPVMGKYFNDSFAVRSTGSGQSVRREISTVPVDGVVCKNSSFLRPAYNIATGLAEILFAMRGQELPKDFVATLGKVPGGTTSAPSTMLTTALPSTSGLPPALVAAMGR